LERGLFTNSRLDYLRKPLFKIFPESCIITSPSESKYLIDECQRLNLPTFCLFETNLFITNATYVIPCNEKDHHAIKLYISLFFLVFAKAYLLRANM
jgi:ribosomal protein S2